MSSCRYSHPMLLQIVASLLIAFPALAEPVQLAAVTTNATQATDPSRIILDTTPDQPKVAALPATYGLLTQTVMGALLPESRVRAWREFLGLGENLGEAYKQLAAAAYQEQDWNRAAALYSVARDLLPEDTSFVPQLGFAYKEIGEYEKSEELLFQATTLEPEEFNYWLWLGDVQRLLGNYEDSYISMLALVENAPQDRKEEFQAYATYTQGLATTVPDWATFERHREFAARQNDNGRWRRVIAEYYNALDVAPEVGFDEKDAPLRKAWVNKTIGSNYNHLKEFEVALDHWRRSVALYEQTESWSDVTVTLQSFAEAYYWLADRDTENREMYYERAIALHEKMEDVAREANEFNHARFALGSRLYEVVQIRPVDDPEVVALRERAFKELPWAPPINDFSVAAIAEGIIACRMAEGDYAGARIVLEMVIPYFVDSRFLTESERGARYLTTLAQVYNEQGHYDQSLFESERAHTELNELRQFLDADAFNRSSGGKTYRHIYAARARSFLGLGEADKALTALESYKTQTRRDLLGSKIVDDAAQIDYRTEEELIRWRLPKLEADLEKAYADRDEPLSSHLERRIASDQARLSRLEKNLVFPPPGRMSLRRIEPMDAEALQENLPEDITLVHFVLDSFGGVAVVARPDGVTGALLPGATDLAVNALVNTFLDNRSDDPEAAKAALGELYALVIAPVRDELKTTTLCIATDETLSLMPFDALHDNGRAMVDDFAIVRVPNGSYLVEARDQNRVAHEDVLALIGREGLTQGVETALAGGAFASVNVLSGESATEDQLAPGANDYDILHLAALADFLNSDAMLSSLELAAGEATDGSLYASELLTLALPASLVVLDIDATTGEATVPGRGLGAFAEGFVHTGVPALLYNLWPDNPEASAAFFKAFYANLATMSKSEALHAAKRALREADSDGFAWSAYVLHGDYR